MATPVDQIFSAVFLHHDADVGYARVCQLVVVDGDDIFTVSCRLVVGSRYIFGQQTPGVSCSLVVLGGTISTNIHTNSRYSLHVHSNTFRATCYPLAVPMTPTHPQTLPYFSIMSALPRPCTRVSPRRSWWHPIHSTQPIPCPPSAYATNSVPNCQAAIPPTYHSANPTIPCVP
jgi:hypothetical protein